MPVVASNSTVHAKAADALRKTAKWPGATGEFTCDDKSDIPDKKIGQKRGQGGEFGSIK